MNRNSGKALDVYRLATNEGGRIVLSLPWRMGLLTQTDSTC
ncbi:hypothetical protein [Streptomyces sp. ALI-76-A]|nr:hypothetical protein [Streptomyces sp. ALI-76-A]MDL5204641.1 hypothetical protein [Streptomyces sp. ALI-76-A]